jgi:anaerobic selenocysteine-containing dehydrogenase
MNRRDFLKSSAAAAAALSVPASLAFAEQERGIVRYPDPWIEVIDPRFERMILFT